MMGLPGKNLCKWKSSISTMTMSSFSEEKKYLARFGQATAKNIISGMPNVSKKSSKIDL